jgi:hypothetical protein
VAFFERALSCDKPPDISPKFAIRAEQIKGRANNLSKLIKRVPIHWIDWKREGV